MTKIEERRKLLEGMEALERVLGLIQNAIANSRDAETNRKLFDMRDEVEAALAKFEGEP